MTTTDAAALERAARIAGLRTRMGLSQRQLALALAVNQSTLSRWERDGAPVLAEFAVAYLAGRKKVHR